eukprot:COSAG02_NODE_23103_length_730_cov_0.977813_1_plen_37_part_01
MLADWFSADIIEYCSSSPAEPIGGTLPEKPEMFEAVS